MYRAQTEVLAKNVTPIFINANIFTVFYSLKCFHFSSHFKGLVHVSEMSATRVEKASEIVDVGEKVWIKVIGREVTHTYIHTPAVAGMWLDVLTQSSAPCRSDQG